LPLKKTHLTVGLIALVIFPLTGAYMRIYLSEAFAQSDRIRFSIRGNHISILLSALIHLGLGSYFRLSPIKRWAILQTAGSVLLIISTALVVLAFFFEPKTALDRPVSLAAMVTASIGCLFHTLCAWQGKV
jgi:hypothetical protein